MTKAMTDTPQSYIVAPLLKSERNIFDKRTAMCAIISCRIVGVMLNRRKDDGRVATLHTLLLQLDDNSAFEFRCPGIILPCSKLESFDLYRLYKRGQNAYENEVLVISNPDGEGVSVVINKLYKWPEPESRKNS